MPLQSYISGQLLAQNICTGMIAATNSSLCLADVKEGVTATAPKEPRVEMPRDNAIRVVTGARALSPSGGSHRSSAAWIPSRWETSAGTLTILDKPTSAVKYARGLVSKTQSKILYPFSS